MLQRLGRPCRQQKHLRTGSNVRSRNRRRLLQDDMRVGATDAERADPGSTCAIPFPGAVFAAHDEGAPIEMQFRVRAGVVQGSRNRSVLKAENRLDQARDPGRYLQVTDVGLDRTKNAWAGSGRGGKAECLSQSFDFDRVTEGRPGSMGLDIADGGRIDVGNRMRLGDHLSLTRRRWAPRSSSSSIRRC